MNISAYTNKELEMQSEEAEEILLDSYKHRDNW
jgi:hypothetical protein